MTYQTDIPCSDRGSALEERAKHQPALLEDETSSATATNVICPRYGVEYFPESTRSKPYGADGSRFHGGGES